MRKKALLLLGIFALGITSTCFAADSGQTELDAVRAELDSLRLEYQTRIEALESRVEEAELRVQQSADGLRQVQQTNLAPSSAAAPISAGNRFNPSIGVIFQGQAWGHGADANRQYRPGFTLGGEAGPTPKGLAIGETEIDISANVDDKFTAWLTLAVVLEDGEAKVEIEEAWLETMALPAGFAARFGRMFSSVGYLNSKHAHSWDFIDQPLAYQTYLGDQYLDDGLQLRWLAPTDVYLELGAEILRGERFPAGGAQRSGTGTRTAFVHAGGDLNESSSWLAGFSHLRTSSAERISGDARDPLLFSGDTAISIAELVWKWSPYGNWREENFKLQAEYFWNNDDGAYRFVDGRVLDYDADQNGWYVQAIYQPFQQWRFGARYDRLSTQYPGVAFVGTELDALGRSPHRTSIMLDWSNSEFSRLRLQYNHDSAGLLSDHQWGLQYIFSIGAHGAHQF